MLRPFNPLAGKTINWKAGCRKTARPVWREGEPNSIGSPYPDLRRVRDRFGSDAEIMDELPAHAPAGSFIRRAQNRRRMVRGHHAGRPVGRKHLAQVLSETECRSE